MSREKKKDRCEASFTIEAALVLSVIFLAIGSLLTQAYRLHDRVIGSMILQETTGQARKWRDEKSDFTELKFLGEEKGNPRLLGERYEIQLKEYAGAVRGTASCGEWNHEIEMRKNMPETFLRRIQALMELGKEPERD